jgi:hypothetical protein
LGKARTVAVFNGTTGLFAAYKVQENLPKKAGASRIHSGDESFSSTAQVLLTCNREASSEIKAAIQKSSRQIAREKAFYQTLERNLLALKIRFEKLSQQQKPPTDICLERKELPLFPHLTNGLIHVASKKEPDYEALAYAQHRDPKLLLDHLSQKSSTPVKTFLNAVEYSLKQVQLKVRLLQQAKTSLTDASVE